MEMNHARGREGRTSEAAKPQAPRAGQTPAAKSFRLASRCYFSSGQSLNGNGARSLANVSYSAIWRR